MSDVANCRCAGLVPSPTMVGNKWCPSPGSKVYILASLINTRLPQGCHSDIAGFWVTAHVLWDANQYSFLLIGGTNFGFMNGANADETNRQLYRPTITSYGNDSSVLFQLCGNWVMYLIKIAKMWTMLLYVLLIYPPQLHISFSRLWCSTFRGWWHNTKIQSIAESNQEKCPWEFQ